MNSEAPASARFRSKVTADQMLTFEIDGRDLRNNYWDNDRCGGVAKMAEIMIGNLRQR